MRLTWSLLVSMLAAFCAQVNGDGNLNSMINDPEEGDEQVEKPKYLTTHKHYMSYDEIVEYLHRLKEKFPYNMEIFELPEQTYENRTMYGVRLFGTSNYPPPEERTVIMMDAGIHGREWVAHASTLFFMEEMLTDYFDINDMNNATFMLNFFDWIIVPMLNPDGYEYSRTTETLWRRNRRVINETCIGVDINRNFPVNFAGEEVNNNCAKRSYPGPEPFSEAESRNMRDLYNKYKDRITAYISVHAYSQFILLRYSYTNDTSPDNFDHQKRVADHMAEEIFKLGNVTYTVGTTPSTAKYLASGTLNDWAFVGKPNIYAMLFELRPLFKPVFRYEDLSFDYDPINIIPTGHDLLRGMLTLQKNIQFPLPDLDKARADEIQEETGFFY